MAGDPPGRPYNDPRWECSARASARVPGAPVLNASAPRDQCLKWRRRVKIIASPRSSAAAITSPSLTDPPG